jgi:hypothetical protein
MPRGYVWMSFDLGVRGDYDGMYEFLDSHEAKECGDSLAIFNYEYKKDIIAELKKDLEKLVNIDKRTRIYVIYPVPISKHKGKFLFGSRKAPPWAGFAPSQDDSEDNVDE